MLDPKEAKKGGFGAFAQRDRERRDAEALKTETPNTGGTPTAPSSSDATGSGRASGPPSTP